MNLLRNFGKNCFDALQSFTNEIQKELESTNWDMFEKEFNEMSKAFKEKLSTFKMKVKEQAEKFYIEVPFDMETQILTYELRPNLITVTVKNDETETSFEETRKYERSIPSSFLGCTITEKYLKNEKVMLFICTKAMNDANKCAEDSKPLTADDVIATINDTTSTNEPTLDDTLVINETTNLNNNSIETTASTISLEEMEEAAEEAIAHEDIINNEILRLYREGWSYRKIGKEVGLSDKTVARRLRKMTMG